MLWLLRLFCTVRDTTWLASITSHHDTLKNIAKSQPSTQYNAFHSVFSSSAPVNKSRMKLFSIQVECETRRFFFSMKDFYDLLRRPLLDGFCIHERAWYVAGVLISSTTRHTQFVILWYCYTRREERWGEEQRKNRRMKKNLFNDKKKKKLKLRVSCFSSRVECVYIFCFLWSKQSRITKKQQQSREELMVCRA